MGNEEDLTQIVIADFEDLNSYIADLMATLPNPVYTVNMAGVIIDSNQALAELSGYPIEELLGRKACTLFADEAEAEDVERRTVAEGYVKNEELTLCARDGKKIPVSILTRARTDESGNTFYVGVLVDITEQKQMVELLQYSERKYRELVENMSEGLCTIDERGIITLVNSRLCQMLGYKSEEIVNTPVFALFDPVNLKILQQELSKRPKGLYSQYEITWTAKSGRKIPTFMSGVPVFGAEGIYNGSYAVVMDITERKEEEQGRAQFINMLAHELNTPLTPIMSSGKLLVEQLELKGKDEYKLARNILNGAHTLSERLSEFLELSKIEMGLIKINPERLEAEELIGEIVEQYAPVFAGKKQKFQQKLEKPLSPVLADEQRTSQILANLLSNASKFTPEKGRVTLRARADGNALVIEVEDNGPGISPDEQAKVFQPYSRSDKYPGMGLGLAIAKQLVELQEGKIWCHSRQGKGSTFGFTLPLYKGER